MTELLRELKENDGFTVKNNKVVQYKTGWQVATRGIECKNLEEAIQKIAVFNGSFGVWFSNGIYYIDECKRVSTKREALQIGRENNQISIFGWQRKNLVYC